jgi:hypothetical protein
VPKRVEFLFFLVRAHHQQTGTRLAYRHAERLYVRDEGDLQREVEVFAPNEYRVTKTRVMQ